MKRLLVIARWTVVVIIVVLLADILLKGKHKRVPVPEGSWGKLMLVLQSVDKDYVDVVNQEKATEDIIPVIMSKLDPHSVYLPPASLKDAEEDLQGGFDGIGIQFNVPNDTAVITNVISGGPAEKAGLLSGDRIVTVGDRNIAGTKFPQDSMVRLMKGKRGTKVTVCVKREGVNDLIPFSLTRDIIPLNSVDVAFMVNDTTGYIKLSKFAKTTYLEFLKATLSLRVKGMKRLIVDLRDNTGGYLDQAIKVCNEFLEKGDLIVYMEGRSRPRQDLFADGNGSCRDMELDVLINESSASSSEIFAGAMQDNDRAVIYGVRSFGKGLVQEPVYFSDGSGIRLTVARFFTPSGRCIQKPYTDDYDYDILERYTTGELLSADSIKVNDSLKFTTKAGRTVYGGGGIIPDVFVPLDTNGVTEYLKSCNKQSLQIKFANKFADTNRAQLRAVSDFDQLIKYLDSKNLKSEFISFTSASGITPTQDEWNVSGEIILTQVRALIGRYSPLNDEAFYPIYLSIDNVFKKVMEQ